MMSAGVVLLAGGTLMLLSSHLGVIIAGLLCNAFGFFLTHSLTNTWINQKADFGKASASSMYSVFYYLGAAAGIYYLNFFWQLAGWVAVVGSSLLILLINLNLILYLARRS